jgi:hypothetical protein
LADVLVAGSTGTIGKEDKPVPAANQPGFSSAKIIDKNEMRAPRLPQSITTARIRLAAASSELTSWASGMYGRSDTRINATGTIEHPPARARGHAGGKYLHTWEAFGVRGPYRLSPDGRRLVKIQDGSVSFSR